MVICSAQIMDGKHGRPWFASRNARFAVWLPGSLLLLLLLLLLNLSVFVEIDWWFRVRGTNNAHFCRLLVLAPLL